MRLVLIALVCNFLSINQLAYCMNDKSLNIFLSESDKPPYHIHTPGNILANVNLLVLGQLIRSEDGFEIQPDILKKFSYDFDSDTYLLELKDNLYFHNGRKATSKDLEFTLVRGFYSSDKSFFHTYLGNILGVRDISKGDRFKSGAIEGIEVVDEYKLRVKLVGPNPSFFHSLTAPYFSLVPMEELEDDYLTWKSHPVGVGPYKIKTPFDGEKTILERASNDAKFKKVVLFSTKKAKTDFDISLVSISNTETFYSQLPVCVRLIEFSNKHPLGVSKKFKKLIKVLMDEIEFKNDFKLSKRTYDILPSHFWGRIDTKDFNLDIKKTIKDLNLKEIDVIVYSGKTLNEKHRVYTEKIEKIFLKYGLKINFIPNSEKFVTDDTASKYPLRFQGIISDYVDPLIMFSAYRKIGHNINYSPLSDNIDKYEELYLNAENSKTFDDRLKSVKELNKFSKDNVIHVPIAEEKMTYFINTNKIKSLGKQINPLTINIDNIELK